MFQRPSPKLRRQLNTNDWQVIVDIEERKGPQAAHQRYCKFIRDANFTFNDFQLELDSYKEARAVIANQPESSGPN